MALIIVSIAPGIVWSSSILKMATRRVLIRFNKVIKDRVWAFGVRINGFCIDYFSKL